MKRSHRPESTPSARRGAVKPKLAAARALRRAMTPAEAHFWSAVRNRQWRGVKVRRAHPIAGFVADFYAPALHLVVELDGDIHASQRDDDARRDQVFGALGLEVVRLRNDDVCADLAGVLERLATRATLRPR